MNKVFFVLIHLGCLGVFWTGISSTAVIVFVCLYLIRMFGITAGYHRYFSHRTYRTSRVFQFLIALLGCLCAQKGPLWWAASHRHHHKYSDTDLDHHSPGVRGIWWAHAGWVLSDEADDTDLRNVKDLAAYPELCWLDRFHFVPPLLLLPITYGLGSFLSNRFPQLHTSGMQMMVWGAFASTVLVYHCTFAINSLAHVLGKQRFKTGDQSKNSFWLAVITLGEGWHNNHHRYPGSERQGYYWWEIDITHYVLSVLALFGIVWELRSPPARLYRDEAMY